MAGESLFAQAPATYEAWLDSLNSTNYISMEILLDEVTIDEKMGSKISGVNSVDQLLHGLAEVEMMRRGAFAAEPVMRGLASERYVATIDGMRIYGACTDKMDPVASYVEKNNLENMNISFGGNDASFGPAIHFKLKKPKFNPIKPAMGLLGLNFSSSDRGFNQLADFNISNSNLAFRGNFMHRKSGSYRQGGGGIVPFSQFEKINYSAAIAYRHDANTLFSLDFLGDDALDIGYPALPMDVAFARARIFSVGVYHIGADGKNELDAKLYHNFIRHEMDDSKRPDVVMRMDMPGETATTGFNVKKGIQKNDKNLAFGLEGFYTRAYAEMTMYPDEGKPMFMLTWPDVKRLGIRPSFNLSWQMTNSELNMGTGVEVAGSRINELGEKQVAIFFERIDNKKLQPLLSGRIGYSLNLDEHWKISSLVSFSERLPSVSEQYGYYIFSIYDGYDYMGNPNLKKEGLSVAQVSVDYIKGPWEIGAEIYRFDFSNYIMGIAETYLSPMTIGANGVKMYSNIGHAQIMGTELDVKVSLSETLRAMNSFAYSHGRDADGDPLPLIPPFKNQLALEYLWNNIKFQPEVVWAAQQNRTSEKFRETQTPSFLLLNLKAQKYMPLGNGRLSMAAGIENLLDRNYKEHLDWGSIPRHGRNFFFNSTLNF
jgi:iron complex outermembrane recepter protein